MQETEMMGVLLELQQLGVTGVNIYYEGGGDSGSIDEGYFTTEDLSDLDIDHAFDKILNDVNAWGSGSNATNIKSENPEIWDKLENFASEKILDNIEDWWNNDGGYGNLCILIPSGKYKIYNNVRYTQVEDYYHEGELIDKCD
jgi:hypothetical protein